MKVKVKKVYYCDYCRKHSLMPIEKHEKHCTANPNRICGLCGRTKSLSSIIKKYKQQMGYTEKPTEWGGAIIENVRQPSLEKIQNEFDYECPFCIFSVIRQIGLNRWPYIIDFNLKEKMQKWWDAVNEADYQSEMMRNCS